MSKCINLAKVSESLVHEKILILDFGGQYKQLIGRKVRELGLFCEIKPCSLSPQAIKDAGYSAIIFTGGPSSVYDAKAPKADPEILNLGLPILGICYGAQWIAHHMGGEVIPCDHAEYGKAMIRPRQDSLLFSDLEAEAKSFDAQDRLETQVWMSHRDQVGTLPEGFVQSAETETCPNAAFEDVQRKIYAVQFHPEVNHTLAGQTMLHNFLYKVCGLQGEWKMAAFADEMIETLKEKLGDSKVLCAFSGGVDSSVAALLVHKAIGQNLTCLFVDHGMLRKNEGDEVERIFRDGFKMNLIRVNAEERFLGELKGVTDPEAKRKIIGEQFIRVFEEEAKKIGAVDYLVQGTIYPDVIESGGSEQAAVIKSHHNVGGLPEHIEFKGLLEPLRDLFKDEVRVLGEELGLPHHLVWRQPFPGPGLAVRCLGELRKEKLDILRDADAIFREEIANAGLEKMCNQYFAVLTNMRSVGVQGDARTYDYTLALRAVSTSDFMTADWCRIPYEVLDLVSRRIINEVGHINRIVYDITSKPPATIEWE